MADELTVQKQTLDTQLSKETLFQVVTSGDTSSMTTDQKLEYYRVLCQKVGVDPALAPFIFIKTQGGERLYASKSLTNQLGMKHNVSCALMKQETISGIFIANYRATSADGRFTDEVGAVPVEGFAKDALANLFMKAHTKAKRRAILSHCGLGMLDESETDTLGGVQATFVPQAPALTASSAPSALEQARQAAAQPAAQPAAAPAPAPAAQPAPVEHPSEAETKKRGRKKEDPAPAAPAPAPAAQPAPVEQTPAPAEQQPLAPPTQTAPKRRGLSDHLADVCSTVGCSTQNGVNFFKEVLGVDDLSKANPIMIRAVLFTLQDWVKVEDRKDLAALICAGKGLNTKPVWMDAQAWGSYIGKFIAAFNAKANELQAKVSGGK